jgi:hypothetical protein
MNAATLPKLSPQQRIRLMLKRVIESGFTSGINGVLSFDLEEDGKITGKFLENRQVYDFAITPNNILSYVESKVRSDAYLIGYYGDSGLLKYGARLDTSSSKRRCVAGKPCGKTCITKGKKCSIKLGNVAAKTMGAIRTQLKSAPPDTNKQDVAKKYNVTPLIAAGAIAGAAVIGMSAASYMAFRSEYREGFKESAEKVKTAVKEKLDKDSDTTPLKTGLNGDKDIDADEITLVVGGFAGQDGKNSEKWAKQLLGNDGLFDNHYVEPIENKEFDVDFQEHIENTKKGQFSPGTITGNNKILAMEMSWAKMLNTAIGKKHNPVSVNLATQAYYYHQKYPDKPINLMGYSAGGMVTHEAAEILKELGVTKNVKTANFGSPYWGLTEKVGDSITFASDNDQNMTGMPIRDRVEVSSVHNHFDYLKNPTVRKQLKGFLGGKAVSGEKISKEQEERIKKAQSRREKRNPEELKRKLEERNRRRKQN